MSEKRKPNWTLCVKDSPDAKWRNIGAAWETEKGNLFVKVDEGEVLRGTAMLFPYREDFEKRRPRTGGYAYMEWKRTQRGKAPPPVVPDPAAPPSTPYDDPDANMDGPPWL